jgi:hypothetical protein
VNEPAPIQRTAWRGDSELSALIRWEAVGYDAYRVSVEIDGTEWSATEPDAFSALVEVRRELDARGILLGVEGAREQSYPSGMARDQGGGLSVYRMELGQRARRDDLRETFAPAGRLEVSTVVAQQAFFESWIEESGGPKDLVPIAEAAGFGVSGHIARGFLFANVGGEIRYSVSFENSSWLIERAERSDPDTFEAEIAYYNDMARFLLLEFGPEIRQSHGLAPVWIPGDELAPGFSAEKSGARETLVHNGRVVATFYSNGVSTTAAEFSRIAELDVAELLASYLHPGGEPHLGQWVVGPATRE